MSGLLKPAIAPIAGDVYRLRWPQDLFRHFVEIGPGGKKACITGNHKTEILLSVAAASSSFTSCVSEHYSVHYVRRDG